MDFVIKWEKSKKVIDKEKEVDYILGVVRHN